MATRTGVFAAENWRAWAPGSELVLPDLPGNLSDGPVAQETPSIKS